MPGHWHEAGGGGGGEPRPSDLKRREERHALGVWCPLLDCYWVGSLDFNFLVEIKGVSTKPPKS